MIDIQQKLKNAFSELNFDQKRHLYFLEGENLPSVSKLVESHAEKFDEAYWLPKKTAKLRRTTEPNITEHELKHRWQTKNQLACDLGHTTHDFLENYTGIESPVLPQQIAGIKFFKDVLKDWEIVARELRMFSRRYRYAGTMDLLLRHRKTGKYVVADYKTNEDLFKEFNFLKPPFEYLACSPYNKYQLQLSYYQILLEDIGVPISERVLVYLMADGTYKCYPLYDYTEYLREILQSKTLVNVERDNW